MERRITGKTKLLGLMGSPVGHSGSPVMYNYSFQALGVDYAYLAFDITEDKVGDAIQAMRTFQMRGGNVTMPCKSAVVPFMDRLSPAAKMIGAVNTIVNDDGVLTGYITDGEGFTRSLLEEGVAVGGKKLTIIGAGGAATAIQVQCALEGAREIAIFNGNDPFYARAEKMVETLSREVPQCKVTLYNLEDKAQLYQQISTSDVLVNGTLVGMKPMENATNIEDVSVYHKDLVVADVVYNPRKTKMLLDAEAAGCKTVGGIGMLLWQGAAAFKLYTGMDMPAEEVREQFFTEYSMGHER